MPPTPGAKYLYSGSSDPAPSPMTTTSRKHLKGTHCDWPVLTTCAVSAPPPGSLASEKDVPARGCAGMRTPGSAPLTPASQPSVALTNCPPS